ncbi:hypothetical protein GCE9029_00146 [Grimontia celer]|uniref:Methyltransferase n=1 Tax=Grimontia celer TaxID=1796497 RepID=A0A128ERY1_9GAMM|nr:CmcJ/NvfI family oxidoreductase [Grimontia celer]CZF77339.1 hypothetical protein GCE9029_00146 [Grimontia celer]
MQNTAIVNYHIKSHEVQAFQFDVDGKIGTLIEPELIPTEVTVQDMREGNIHLNVAKDGVTFKRSPSQIDDFESTRSWQSTYDQELESLLKTSLGAQEVIVFDHTVRIDDSNATRRPARNVHNDYSQDGAEQRLIDIVGEEKARIFSEGHYAFINVWRPVEHVIRTAPLGFIHPDSMRETDWMNIELVYPNRHGQILGVAANPEHRWFYLSEMTPEEVAIFNIYDNEGLPHVGHSALDMDSGKTSTKPRKSIESRTLVRY